jgi:hypothetical protein
LAVLSAAYGGRQLDRNHPADRYLLRALEMLREGLEGLARVPKELQPVVDARQACRIVLAELAGEGIPPEDLDRVFDRFFRGDPAHDSSIGVVAQNFADQLSIDIGQRCEPGARFGGECRMRIHAGAVPGLIAGAWRGAAVASVW